jgi:hypothetical protein
MSAFGENLRQRLAETRRALAAAQRDGDDHGVRTYSSEVEDLERVAAAHGIVVTPEPVENGAE